MIRHNNKIILTSKECGTYSDLVGEPRNPRSIAEYNAWLDGAHYGCDQKFPELRILAAVLLGIKLPE